MAVLTGSENEVDVVGLIDEPDPDGGESGQLHEGCVGDNKVQLQTEGVDLVPENDQRTLTDQRLLFRELDDGVGYLVCGEEDEEVEVGDERLQIIPDF